MPPTDEEIVRQLCDIEYDYVDSPSEMVFGDKDLAVATRASLTAKGITELRAPYLDVKRGEGGDPIAYVVRLPESALLSIRLQATMFLARSGFFRQHPRAEIGSRVAANLLARGNDSDYHVTHAWVAPDIRYRGLGRSLITQCIDEARDLGFARVVMETSVRTRALNLYDRIGFRRRGEASVQHPDTGATVTFVHLEFPLR